MSIQLYNTMTKSKETVDRNGPLRIYTCGPTVYMDPQIGNWRAFLFYDTLIRALKLANFDVKHVLNITDVGHLVNDDDDVGDDKLDKQAKLQRKTAWEIAEAYTQSFIAGMEELNIQKPTKMPKASDHIRQQIAMVQAIESAGYTYRADDGIYFDTTKLQDYGKLAGGRSELNEKYARIDSNSCKQNPQDFALWKFSPKDQKRDMEWDSPWGIGFPGWHIECSAMAKEYLGDTLDIHAGGIDHIPIHHSNEIAQSEVANGVEFSKIWMHCEFIKVDNRKMSKSLGNSYTLADLQNNGFTPLDYRMLVMQGHYRTETNFSWDNLSAAKNRRIHLLQFAEKRWQNTDEAAQSVTVLQQASARFSAAIFDDLNTPSALAIVSEVEKAVESPLNSTDIKLLIEFLQLVDKALGLALLESTPDIADDYKELIARRIQAKEAKDFETADTIREKMTQNGIELLDTPSGTSWKRIY